jgi:hypothetical protein
MLFGMVLTISCCNLGYLGHLSFAALLHTIHVLQVVEWHQYMVIKLIAPLLLFT